MVTELADDLGVILRQDAVAHGYQDHELAAACRRGDLVRLRHGAYAVGAVWLNGTAADRHLMLSRAVMRRWGDGYALSHESACLLQGGPARGLDVTEVSVTGLHGRGDRVRARVRHRRGVLRGGDVTRADGHFVTSPTRTCLDLAGRYPRDVAVGVLDDFLHRGLTTTKLLEHHAAARENWTDHAAMARVLQLARPGAESVGETLLRMRLLDLGLPEPQLQREVRDGRGRLIGRTDMALPALKLLIEFDGMEKYHRYRRPGESVADMVIREKVREDRLRAATGWVVVRFTWADLWTPGAIAEKIRAAAAAAA